MFDRVKDLVAVAGHRRSLRRWGAASDAAEGLDLSTLRRLRSQGRQERRNLDRFLFVADEKLMLPVVGSNAIRKPMHCDWAYRPEIWRGPLGKFGMSSVNSQTEIGSEAKIFHDCRQSELTYRQIRNTREEDLAPYGLRMDVFGFEGSFLSLVIDLPPSAVDGLTLNHLIRLDPIVETEKPLEIFARLNVKHGPNQEQMVRELPLNDPDPIVEFDLAYSRINEKRVERMWLDLIFEDPQMNQITLRDVTLTRRPRSEL